MKIETKIKSAFTLIELLVVISIIALLASVMLVAISSQRQKSRDAKRLADVQQLAKAFELFYGDTGSYPTTDATIGVGQWGKLWSPVAGIGNCVGIPGCIKYLVPSYIIAQIPSAPLPADGTCRSVGNAGGAITKNEYEFLSTNSTNLSPTFTLVFCLGGQAGSLGAGVHTVTEKGME